MLSLLWDMTKEIKSHKFIFIFLVFILVVAFFLRVYRIDMVLGFYFDQGRDGLIVWDLIKNHRLFLIGPTTGIAGIFRGPFYYYLITPFYWLGKGNPVFPSIFLSATSVGALFVLYQLSKKIMSREAGLMGTAIGAVSFYIVLASRWLSNPTPMLLLSMLLVYGVFLVLEGRQWAWVLISFVAGCSLFHFGSSGEFFYFPALFIFFLWQTGMLRFRIKLPPLSIILSSLFVFALTAVPLVIFDMRHDNILSHNISSFLFDKESFKGSFMEVLPLRLNFYYTVFSSKLFDNRTNREIFLMIVPLLAMLLKARTLLKNKYFVALLIFFLSPLVGLLFFQGNEGNIYDYYLTGYYLIFILFYSVGLGILYKYTLGKIFLVIFFVIFLHANVPLTLSRLSDNGDGSNTIIFANEKLAVEWIYADAKGADFNADFYVPPVIPYAYDYLFTWYSETNVGYVRNDQLSRLYTLYEEDPPHPERLLVWTKRQEGIGKVLYQQKFGGITVQRRERIKNEKAVF